MSNKPKLNLEALKTAIEIAGGLSSLAVKSNVAYQSIIDWKSGRKTPSVESCIKIEKALNGKITKEDLLQFPWDTPKTNDNKELEIAKKMLGMGMSKENISEATGLSAEAIEKLEDKFL